MSRHLKAQTSRVLVRRNRAKNAVLAVLIVLLAALSAANWLIGLGQVPADSPFRELVERFSGGAFGYELRSSGIAAAEPSQIALSIDGQLYAVQYNPGELDAALAATQPVWAELLDTNDQPQTASDSELAEALQTGDCMLLRYDGAAPLGIIAGWVGSRNNSNTPVRSLIYAAGRAQLFLRAEDGSLFTVPAKADTGLLQQAQKDFHGTACSFAGAAYDVWPETLIFERETLSLSHLAEDPIDLFAAQSGVSLQTLLDAFSYTPYARSYSDQSGAARVFVSEGSTLRISREGTVQFTALGDSTVRAYEEGELEGASALDAQIDCARQVLDTAVRSVETGTQPSLCAVRVEEDGTTLTFLQTFGGVPVLGQSDFATLVFQGNALVSATVYLQRFLESGTSETVLPARQAAASADGRFRGLAVVYRQSGETYAPSRCFLRLPAESE